MTTALLILDVQNYFALHENETCVFEPQSDSSQANRLEYYKRINSVMVPTIQDVLLASRASEGMEVVYSIVESATQDGRDRSRAHKHAGIHVAKSGFGAKILTRVTPTDNDIVIPRTGIKYVL
jgi:ureidoacrylate peracid hydrolase